MDTATPLRLLRTKLFRSVRVSHLAVAAFIVLAPATSVNSCSTGSTPTDPTTTTAPATTTPATTAPATTAPATTAPATTTTRPTTTTTTTTTTSTTTTSAPATNLALRVSGNHFVNAAGQTIQLRGVNRPSTEYRCVQNIPYGFVTDDNGSDGQSAAYAAKVVTAIQSWTAPGGAPAINTVRIPLNEDCWLGINGATPAYSGAAYQNFIRTLVTALTNAGIYTVLDLHWSAPGATLPTGQDVAPNADHSVTFWSQVASTFKGSPSVAFDLFNEPHLWCYSSACQSNYTTASQTAWSCYRDGCAYGYLPDDNIDGRSSGTFQVAGTQQLVNAIRAQGANNVILIAGLGYANALDNWMAYKPTDPQNQIAVAFHTYPNSGATVNTQSYMDSMMSKGGLNTAYPVYIGEFGEFLCSGASTGFTANTMTWADGHGYSYTAWGWDKGEGCSGPTLVSSNSGTPTAFGSIVQAHLRTKAG